jgi:hypothetical protein
MFSDIKLEQFKDIYSKDDVAIVCGLGKSLEMLLPKYKSKYIIFGVNDFETAFKTKYRPDYLVISEDFSREQFSANATNIEKTNAMLNSRCKYIFSVYDNGYTYTKPIKITAKSVLEKMTIEEIFKYEMLFAYRKITTLALSLAIWMGFKNIGLIGFDLTGDRICRNSTNALNIHTERRERDMQRACNIINCYAQANNIDIYNLSNISIIEAFRKIDIQEFDRLMNLKLNNNKG